MSDRSTLDIYLTLLRRGAEPAHMRSLMTEHATSLRALDLSAWDEDTRVYTMQALDQLEVACAVLGAVEEAARDAELQARADGARDERLADGGKPD